MNIMNRIFSTEVPVPVPVPVTAQPPEDVDLLAEVLRRVIRIETKLTRLTDNRSPHERIHTPRSPYQTGRKDRE